MAAAQLDFERALPDLDAAIAAGIQDPRAWWARARCRSAKGEEAAADLRKAIELEPLNPRHRYELSRILARRPSAPAGDAADDGQKLANEPEARRQAGLAAELDPDNDFYRRWFERFE